MPPTDDPTHSCTTCKADVSDVQPGFGAHLGAQVHLVDTGPRHNQIAVHPVLTGARYGRTLDQVNVQPLIAGGVQWAAPATVAGVIFWPDYSEWQSSPFTAACPFIFISYRISLGMTVIDAKARPNTTFGHNNAGPGRKLIGHEGYHVWYPGNEAGQAAKFLANFAYGTYGVAMIDVETWSGAIRGDHSAQLNALANALAATLGQRRVKAYGNESDLAELWPNRPAWLGIQKARYDESPPAEPWQGWQFTDGDPRWPVPNGWPRSSAPAGPADHNAFYGTPAQFQATFGITPPKPPPPPKPPTPPTPVALKEDPDMLHVTVNKASTPAGVTWPGGFLQFGDGRLYHLVNSPSAIAYSKVIPSVTIEYAEYAAMVKAGLLMPATAVPPAAGEVLSEGPDAPEPA